MRILIAGAQGQVGKNIVSLGESYDFKIFGLGRSDFDITSMSSILRVMNEIKPDLLINAAAYTDVDKAENNIEEAYSINDKALGFLTQVCAKMDIPLFHISTDYVFDGLLERPYVEIDRVAPQGIYAKSKEAGECKVRENLSKHIILRTSWVFSQEGDCFPKTILRLAKKNTDLKVVDDQIGGPTSAYSIAYVLLHMAQEINDGGLNSMNWGTYHHCQLPYVSWYEYANQIIELAKQKDVLSFECSIIPCSSNLYPNLANRPANSQLDISKLLSNFKIRVSSWKDDISELISNIER